MKRGQVWIETVIYTLVGLALIGLVLGVVTPRINEYRDKAVIEQTISVMNSIDSVIKAISTDPGNARVIDVRIKEGTISVDSDNEKISYLLEDSDIVYSEEGITTQIGNIDVLTSKVGNRVDVMLSLDYSGRFDIFEEANSERIFAPSPVPYRFRFENIGLQEGGNFYQIDFREISSG